jgi:Arc/MetJ family transcription regulator
MRTNIDIDDELMAAAMQASGLTTKRETVEAGLRVLVQRHKAYAAAMSLAGQIDWQGDLDAERRDKRRPEFRVAEPAVAYKAKHARSAKTVGKSKSAGQNTKTTAR